MGEPNMSAFLDIESGFIRIRFKVLQMFTNPHNNKRLFLEISHNVSYCADSKDINLAKWKHLHETRVTFVTTLLWGVTT